MSYRKPDAQAAQDKAHAEWRKHAADHPGHVSYSVAIPYGWLCCGGLDGKPCQARSASLQGPT